MEPVDLTVIGAGPGGYVAAIRAAKLGMKVAIVEREKLGGVCLNWGCIPTKALLRSAERLEFLHEASRWGFGISEPAVDWKRVIARSREAADRLSRGVDFLMKKNKIAVVPGRARFLTPSRIEVTASDGRRTEVSTTRAIIATGARPSSLPGVTIDGKRVISSREAMVLPALPRSITVIGAGAIGLEFAYFFASFGSKVTIIEYLDRLLPVGDAEICASLDRAFRKRGVEVHVSSRVSGVAVSGEGTITSFEKGGSAHTAASELTLLAVGVRGNVEDLGLEDIGVAVERATIRVDEHLRTSISGVYAIGDVCGQPALAHVASAEGVHAVEHMAGKEPRPIDYDAIPACVYCQPQVGSVGLTEAQARERGHEVRVGKFPFAACGKAVAVSETEGYVKIVSDARHGEILGAHIIGSEATELIAELGLAKAAELTVHDVHAAIHSHPTLSEATMEAAADSLGEALQI